MTAPLGALAGPPGLPNCRRLVPIAQTRARQAYALLMALIFTTAPRRPTEREAPLFDRLIQAPLKIRRRLRKRKTISLVVAGRVAVRFHKVDNGASLLLHGLTVEFSKDL